MKVLICCLPLLLMSVPMLAQTTLNTDLTEIDEQMKRLPDAHSRDIRSLARFIENAYSSDLERVRAIYAWIGQHISYDVGNLYEISYLNSPDWVFEKTLQTRKAICHGYSAVFDTLCKELDIPSAVVWGYVRLDGSIGEIAHTWNAARIQGDWYLFDPTWGAGYVKEKVFYSSYNEEFFMQPAEKFLLNHMPFDPIWQLSSRPVSDEDFHYNRMEPDSTGIEMDFEALIDEQLSLTGSRRLAAMERRIVENRVTNPLTREHLNFLRGLQHNEAVGSYNTCASQFNETVKLMNEFVTYRNNQFRPVVSDKELLDMIARVEEKYLHVLSDVNKIPLVRDEGLRMEVERLKGMVQELHSFIYENKSFVDRYIGTDKSRRVKLFYQKS